MQTLMKNAVALMIFLSTSIGLMGSVPEITVMDAGQKSFALYIENAESGYLQIAVKDKKGVTLLSDHVKYEETCTHKYNLATLPAGAYTLFVEDGVKTLAQPLILDADGLEIPENEKVQFFAPAVAINQDKMDFTMLCLNEAAVTIEILDETGYENYARTTIEQGSVQRRFDISGLGSGQYTIVTRVKGDNIEKVYREVFTRGEDIAGN